MARHESTSYYIRSNARAPVNLEPSVDPGLLSRSHNIHSPGFADRAVAWLLSRTPPHDRSRRHPPGGDAVVTTVLVMIFTESYVARMRL